VCVSPYYLVSGPEPVPDDKLTSSSIWTREWLQYHGQSEARLHNLPDTDGVGAWSPAYANINEYIQVRLLVEKRTTLFHVYNCYTGQWNCHYPWVSNPWYSFPWNSVKYCWLFWYKIVKKWYKTNILQVQFDGVRLVQAVATQGRSHYSVTQYVTKYRIMHSTDCVHFVTYRTRDGVDMVWDLHLQMLSCGKQETILFNNNYYKYSIRVDRSTCVSDNGSKTCWLSMILTNVMSMWRPKYKNLQSRVYMVHYKLIWQFTVTITVFCLVF